MKTVGYYAICPSNPSSGVYKKIDGFVKAANKLGYLANHKLINGGGFSHIKLAMAVGFADEDLVVVRGNSYGFFLLMFGLIFARLRGKKVVLDIATPMSVMFHEINSSSSTFFVRFLKLFGLIISGPWSFWAANRIIQYAQENIWFSLGSQRKTVLIGNGIDVSTIPIRHMSPEWPNSELRLIGVAQLSRWHGYDLVIKAISEFNKRVDRKFEVIFTIVGGGDELDNLKDLTGALSLESKIRFSGNLQGNDLYREYDDAHCAISSLGLHRIGLNQSSVLKAREYCSIGIPFLSAGIDPDFPQDIDFRYQVDLCDDYKQIVDFLIHFEFVRRFQEPAIIRKYAEDNLDIQAKIKSFLDI